MFITSGWKKQAGLAMKVLVLGVAIVLPSLTMAAAKKHPDFTGMWRIADYEFIHRPGEREEKAGEYDLSLLTSKAREAAEFFKEHRRGFDDDAITHCVPHGMPWIMTSPARDYLIDFYQTDDRITLIFEGMDVHRMIFFNQKAVPENFAPSTNGYSIAHWEGDTLIIETTHLRPKNPYGMMQRSENAKVTERWRLIQHPKFGKALDIDVTMEDPDVFIKPVKGHNLLLPALPGSTINAYGCNESVWDDYVDQVLKKQWEQEGK